MSNGISSNESDDESKVTSDNSYKVDEESIDDKSKSTISNVCYTFYFNINLIF